MSDFSQGPGWWQASDGKWYPPEQAPGYQPPAGAPMPGAGGTDVGSVLTYAWNKFIKNIGEWIVLWLILIGIAILSYVVIAAATVGASFTAVRFNFLGIILGIVFGVITGVMYVVVAKGAVMAVNGQRVDVGACFRLTGNNIVAGAIFGLLLGVANALCCLIAIPVFLFLGFLPILSAMDDKGADGISEAVSLSTGRAGESMVFWLIGWLIEGIGCLLFIGAPIIAIGAVYLVRRFRGEPIAA